MSNPVPVTLSARVAVPVSLQVIKPSLIPEDVLEAAEREATLDFEDAEEVVETSPTRVPVKFESSNVGHVPTDVTTAMSALSQTPLFRELTPESLRKLSHGATQVEIPGGEYLFHEGEAAPSFFVVLEGTLEVLRHHKGGRGIALRHAKKHETCGLFGLFSAQIRAASTRAIGDCVVLEIRAERLDELLRHDALAHQRLLKFYRERLVESFMASRLFSDIDSIARARLIGRFAHRELEKTTLVHPGEVSNFLAVVTHGRLVLEDRSLVGQSPREFEVTQGQFLAMTCALSGQPSKMRVVAHEFTTLAQLSHKDLNELMRDYPALRSLPLRLPKFGRMLDRDIFCGGTGVPGL